MDNPARAAIFRGMSYDSDIVIVGGGLNGPALALALAGAGHSVTVIDALDETVRKNAAFDGRSYALALGSVRLLQAIGIWDRIEGDAQPMLEIKVTDGRAGEGPSPFWMHFDHAEIEEGPMGHMVEDRHLRRALLEAMEDAGDITRISGRTVVEQDGGASGATVTLDDGAQVRARLLVGSDGRASGTARRGSTGDPTRWP
jgi:2-octaprenyl-6-methoxyphenol hydroxylase